jgi:hypothetical protein
MFFFFGHESVSNFILNYTLIRLDFSCALKKGVLIQGRLYMTQYNLFFKASLVSTIVRRLISQHHF